MIIFNTVPNIKIDLNPGIYVFDCESATGKTYLGKMLEKLSTTEDVAYYTYSDYVKGMKLSYIKNLKMLKVLFIDRFDRYVEDIEISETINNLSNTCIILLDLKSVNRAKVNLSNFVYLELSEKCIEVTE